MADATQPIRIGYVPEHYLTPLHLALPHFPPSTPVTLVPFPSGTGHMITSFRANEIDIGIGLTEGWVAGLTGKDAPNPKNSAESGYRIVGQWVETPLRWAIVTGAEREDIQSVEDLKGKRVGISRPGSGSHIMAFPLAHEHSFDEPFILTPLGPFPSLRNGVSGTHSSNSAAEFFMWEHFTTKPYFTGDFAELKKIGEIYTPWPSWHIAASNITFPDPAHDERLNTVFEAFDQGIKDFEKGRLDGSVVKMLGTGELGCHYSEADAREWLKDVKYVKSTRGTGQIIMRDVIRVLRRAGVVSQDLTEGYDPRNTGPSDMRGCHPIDRKPFWTDSMGSPIAGSAHMQR